MQSPETEDDSDPKDFGIEMTEIGGEIFNNSNEFLSDIDEEDEILFEDSNKVKNSSLDQQVGVDNSKNDSDNELTASKETPEKLFSTCTSDSDSNLELKELLDVSNVSRKQQGIEKKITSISLPETDTSRPRMSNDKFGGIESLAKPKYKPQRRRATQGAPQDSRHFHHSNCRLSLKLYNFLDDEECHAIWKPDSGNETEPVQRKFSSSTVHGPGTPSDLRQKQKQLLERVNVAQEVAKDQNIALVQKDVSHIVKQRSLRLSSRYVSSRMSKKLQQKNGPRGRSTSSEGNAQDVPSLAGINSPSLKQKSSVTSLSCVHFEMLPANAIHSNSRKKPLLSEVNKSQSEYICSSESKSSRTAKKGALKTCNSYPVMDTRSPQDNTSGVKMRERQDSAKTNYFVSKKTDSSAQMQSSAVNKDCNNVLEFVPGENADCSEAAVPVHESIVAGNTSSNNSTSSGHDKGTVHTGSVLTTQL